MVSTTAKLSLQEEHGGWFQGPGRRVGKTQEKHFWSEPSPRQTSRREGGKSLGRRHQAGEGLVTRDSLPAGVLEGANRAHSQLRPVQGGDP